MIVTGPTEAPTGALAQWLGPERFTIIAGPCGDERP